VTFVSKASLENGVVEKMGLQRKVLPVQGCRNISKNIWYTTMQRLN